MTKIKHLRRRQRRKVLGYSLHADCFEVNESCTKIENFLSGINNRTIYSSCLCDTLLKF